MMIQQINSTHEPDDGAPNDSYVAISGKNKAQDDNHNIVRDLIHTDQPSHTITTQLSERERQNVQPLTSLN